MDAECARMNCDERATVLMAYDPRNARAWLRDLTDAHPSLGLSLCSWHAASTSVPMGWECIDERRGMRFGLDDIDEPEAGFLFTEEPISTRRLLSDPSSLDIADDTEGAVVESTESGFGSPDPASDFTRRSTSGSPDLLSTGGQSGRWADTDTETDTDTDDSDPVVAEPYVTRFDDRGRFDDPNPTPVDPIVAAAPAATSETDDAPADPEPILSWIDDDDGADAAESSAPTGDIDAESEFDLPEPEPIRILDREEGRTPSVSYFDDDGYSEPIAVPLDEIDGIELGFEPLMPGDELNDLKLEAAERFTVIEPAPEEEFDDFEPVPEPIPSATDSVSHLANPELAVDAAADGEYLLTPDLELGFDADDGGDIPHLVAVDSSAPTVTREPTIDGVDRDEPHVDADADVNADADADADVDADADSTGDAATDSTGDAATDLAGDAATDLAGDAATDLAGDAATDLAGDAATDADERAGGEPQGFSAEFLASEPIDEPPMWADDAPAWRSEPELAESPQSTESVDASEGPGQAAGVDGPDETAEVDEAFELPRLFDDIGYAQLDDAESDDAPTAADDRSTEDEEIDPADELSFDDIFPSMVNRPAAQPQEHPRPPQRSDRTSPYNDPQASVTQPSLPTIGPAPLRAPERSQRDDRAPEQLRPPVARTNRSAPSFEHLVFQEEAADSAKRDEPASSGPPAPTSVPTSTASAPLPRLFANNHVEVRQLAVDASTPLLNRAFGFVPRD